MQRISPEDLEMIDEAILSCEIPLAQASTSETSKSDGSVHGAYNFVTLAATQDGPRSVKLAEDLRKCEETKNVEYWLACLVEQCQ